jgi:hypothetical protein
MCVPDTAFVASSAAATTTTTPRDGVTVLRDPLAKRLWSGLTNIVNLGSSAKSIVGGGGGGLNAVRSLAVAFGRGASLSRKELRV